MLNIRKYLITALPLKNVVFHSTKTHKRQTLPTKNKRLRNRSDVFYQRNFGPNPGLDQQLNSLQLKDMEIQNKKEVLHPDVVENFEKQFWDSDKMHDMMERENSMYHEALGLQQVMRKHFKTEKNPNMLLYDEKLAIKALHNEDPEKWTVMKLAFSFPASPPIIKKILKTNVKLRSQAEIQKHDQRVRRNWEALAKDKLTVSDKDLKDHLISFSNRSKLTETSREMTAISNNRSEENPLKKVLCDEGVFSNIYKSYKNLHHPESKNEASTSQKTNNVIEEGLKMLYHPPKNDTFILPKSVQRHKSSTTEHMTLKEMRKRDSLLSSNQTGLHDNDRGTVLNEDWISNREHNLPKLEDPIGIALGKEKQNHTFEDKDEVSLEISGTNDGLLPTGKKGTVSQNASKYVDMEKLSELEKRHMENLKNMIQTAKLKRSEDDSDAIAKAVKSYVHNSSESYPLNIKIPDDLKRKGVLYRIRDRFYTDDGEFLFRVPGLLKQ